MKLELLKKGEAYKPNYSDKRTARRVISVLDWCNSNLSETIPTQVHHDTLTAVFGPSGNKLSKFLRTNLLVQVGEYKPGVSSFKYLLNAVKAEQCSSMVNTSSGAGTVQLVQDDLQRLRMKFASELQSGQFKYTRSSERDWHPLQNIPNKGGAKQRFWADQYPHNYDFVACAPTILSQLAARTGMPDIVQGALLDYLKAPQGFREHVSQVTGLPMKQAKQLVNSLFNGARLSRSTKCAAYQLMGFDYEAMTRLQEDEQVTHMRNAIRRVWKWLEQRLGREFKKAGAKWSLYFACERKIMDVVSDFLTSRGIKFFTEHDGFRTSHEIDVDALLQEIQTKTGFKMKLKKE